MLFQYGRMGTCGIGWLKHVPLIAYKQTHSIIGSLKTALLTTAKDGAGGVVKVQANTGSLR